MNPQTPFRRTVVGILLALAAAFSFISIHTITSAQGQVQVTAAVPSAAEQGTINLNVKVTGKGFKNGAQAKWFVTGTTNPGGVTVNSTTFVSSTEVTANITVADTAVIANFDIQVSNPDGRGGKGTELFAVTPKGGGSSNCPAMQPAPTSDTKCYAGLAGCLDASFGSDGFAHIDPYPTIASSTETADAVAVQPDGKIVLAGRTRTPVITNNLVIVRYNADGTLDTAFGDQDSLNPSVRLGYTVAPITTGLRYSMVIQPDGRILICGWNSDSVVVRYNADGTPDPTFGSGGTVNLGVGAPGQELALQTDGKILVGGGESGFSVARLNPNGSFDSSFGVGGIVKANPSGVKRGTGRGWSLAIQRVPAVTGEERIVVAGWSRTSAGSGAEWTMMRFKPNGATDTSFGSNGVVKTTFYGFGDQARRVKIDSSNRIVAAGIVRSASESCGDYVVDAAVVRYSQNGSLDGGFSGGKQIADVYGGNESLYALELQTDGKVVILTTSRDSTSSVFHFALVRFNTDGTRDSSFGLLGNGVVTTDFYGYQNWGFALAVQPSDGKIVAAGQTFSGPNLAEVVVARYLP